MKHKPKKFKWTKQQTKAIKNRGCDLFVTASAGTGKTAVLSSRCADLVSEKTDIRNILILTFTDAAAEQMRQRIAQQLQDTYYSKKDSHLRRQLLMLNAADISTIHAFCKRLITEFFFKLSLDPTFRVIDEDEQYLLKTEVLEQTIDWAWSQPNITNVLEELLYRRDLRTTDGFAARIIQIHSFLEHIVSSDEWFRNASELLESKDPFKTNHAEQQKKIIAEKINDILSQLRHAAKIVKTQNSSSDWLNHYNDKLIPPIQKCLDLLSRGQWDNCSQEIINFKKPRVLTPKDIEKDIADLVHDTAKEAIDSFAGFTELAVLNPEYLKQISGSVSLQTKVLLELVKTFDRLYTKAKMNINALDFSDLEHYALKLLTDDTGAPSETALLLRKKYTYIFVDEYQDINPVQKYILDTLHSKDNIFVVGDIKQSIYAFRGAEPGIFLKNIKQASTDIKDKTSGYRIDLNLNFRSEKPILDFVNLLFSRIMTAPLAQFDYDDTALLRPCDEKSTQAEPLVELHILDKENKNSQTNDDTAEDAEATARISSRQQQAALIAQRIKQMVGTYTGKAEFQIHDRHLDALRDVQYRDIVILMRSPSSRVDDYTQILRLAGIPVTSEFGAGYFQATEIADLLSLLKILDNPQRDIELAAVLRSPFFNFTDAELAHIRLHSIQNNEEYNLIFYDSLTGYTNTGPDAKLKDKVKSAFAQIESWRCAARRGSLADLIWHIYRQTNYLAFVTALPNGRLRKANLLKLHNRAIQFEGFAGNAGQAALNRFVDFLEKLDEAGREWAPAKPESVAGNAVRIMSIHKSKGLEFPIVFISELNTPFNLKEKNADCLTSPTYTLGLQVIDRQTNSKISSLAHQVIAEEKAAQQLAEEMRILYVAATRPMQRLILTGALKQKKCRHILTEGWCFGDEAVASWKLKSNRSALEWILYGLSNQAALHKCFETSFADKTPDDRLFTVRWYDQKQLNTLSGTVQKLRNAKRRKTIIKPKPSSQSSELFNKLKDALIWRYQFSDAPLINAKHSVTALTHVQDEFSLHDYSQTFSKQPKAAIAAAPEDARLIGSAAHLLIANLDLSRQLDKKTIEQTIQNLISENAVIPSVAEKIDTASILSFFESDLGQRALKHKQNLCREWPFTLGLPASELPDTASNIDEPVIIQGIIDMFFEIPDGLVIIDFKTDKIDADQIEDRVKAYSPQLILYAKAAQKILNKKIAVSYLYFLSPGCDVKIT